MHSDDALEDVARLAARHGVEDPAALEAFLDAVQLYGDLRADEALAAR